MFMWRFAVVGCYRTRSALDQCMPIIEVTDLYKTFRSKLKEPGLKSSLQSLVSPRYKMVEAVKKISFSCEES
jgi:hypothetical protein